MVHTATSTVFKQMLVDKLRKYNGTVPTARAADRDRQLAFPFRAVKRQKKIQKIQKPALQTLCLIKFHDKIAYRFFKPGMPF